MASGNFAEMAMTKSVVIKFFAVGMAVVLPVSIISAETRGAMMYASGTALLNGKIIDRNSAIFPGDKIQVSAKSAVTITMAGSSILVPSQSSVTFNGDSVALAPQTAVAINTSVGLAAQVEHLKFIPSQKS